MHNSTTSPLNDAAVANAVAAERVRIRSILESPEAVGREVSAATIAYGGGYTAIEARAQLATMQKDDVDFSAFKRVVDGSVAAKRGASQRGATR